MGDREEGYIGDYGKEEGGYNYPALDPLCQP